MGFSKNVGCYDHNVRVRVVVLRSSISSERYISEYLLERCPKRSGGVTNFCYHTNLAREVQQKKLCGSELLTRWSEHQECSVSP